MRYLPSMVIVCQFLLASSCVYRLPVLGSPSGLKDDLLQQAYFRTTGFSPHGVNPPLKLAWKRKLGGAITSSSIAFGNVIYVGALDKKIYAIDAISGKIIGKYQMDGPITNPPLFSRSYLFVNARSGKLPLRALKLSSGKPAWRKKMTGYPFFAGSYDGRVFVATEKGHIMALEDSTGKEVWSFKTDGLINSSPSIMDSTLFVGSRNGYLYALNLITGKLLWKRKLDGGILSRPTSVDRCILVGTTSGMFYCLKDLSGDNIWTFRAETGIWNGAATDGKIVYFGSLDRNLYALNVEDGKLLWRFTADGPIRSAPIVTEKTVYFGSLDGYLYGLDSYTGKSVWKYRIGSPIESSLEATPKGIYIGSTDQYVYAFVAESRQ